MYSSQVVKQRERRILKIKIVAASGSSVKSSVAKIEKTRAMKELNKNGAKWTKKRRKRESKNFGTKPDVTIINWDSKPDCRRWLSLIWKRWWSTTLIMMKPMRPIKVIIISWPNWNGIWLILKEHFARLGISWSPWWRFIICLSFLSFWFSLSSIKIMMLREMNIWQPPVIRSKKIWKQSKFSSTLCTFLRSFSVS